MGFRARADAVLGERGLDRAGELHRELLAPQLVVRLDEEGAQPPARVRPVRRPRARVRLAGLPDLFSEDARQELAPTRFLEVKPGGPDVEEGIDDVKGRRVAPRVDHAAPSPRLRVHVQGRGLVDAGGERRDRLAVKERGRARARGHHLAGLGDDAEDPQRRPGAAGVEGQRDAAPQRARREPVVERAQHGPQELRRAPPRPLDLRQVLRDADQRAHERRRVRGLRRGGCGGPALPEQRLAERVRVGVGVGERVLEEPATLERELRRRRQPRQERVPQRKRQERTVRRRRDGRARRRVVDERGRYLRQARLPVGLGEAVRAQAVRDAPRLVPGELRRGVRRGRVPVQRRAAARVPPREDGDLAAAAALAEGPVAREPARERLQKARRREHEPHPPKGPEERARPKDAQRTGASTTTRDELGVRTSRTHSTSRWFSPQPPRGPGAAASTAARWARARRPASWEAGSTA